MELNNLNPILTAMSLMISIISAWTALDMASRVTKSQGIAARLWLIGGGIAMGTGVWAMHFIGMQAMVPAIGIRYNLLLSGASLIIAIVSSLFALWLVTMDRLHLTRLLPGALIMGAGIAAMHYTGMSAIDIESQIIWNYGWVVLSVAISLLASLAALYLTFLFGHEESQAILIRFGAAFLMGIAISGMHYTGMMAAQFPPSMVTHTDRNNSLLLDGGIILVTILILGTALLISFLDARQRMRTSLLVSSLESANKELAQLALHDALTKLPNRSLLEDRLNQAISKNQREGNIFALMFMDIDSLKTVNDVYGHIVGDRLLIAASSRLLQPLSGQYTLARIGGGEFALLVDVTAPDDVARLAKNLVRVLEKPFIIKQHEIRITLSIGIVLYPVDGKSERELMFNANAAMCHTKLNGRNSYGFFQPSMNIFAQQQLELMEDLWSSIGSGQLILHYQPKFRAYDRTLTGFEALLRWQHPSRGLLMPDLFLPLAEKSGLILALGSWVINEACRQLSEWREQGKLDWTVAVNISALQFGQPKLFEELTDTLARHKIPPTMLILEVTESVALHNPEQSINVLTRLAEIGVTASLDDFGTGYSSLLYLKRLPVRELKIDRAFVKELRDEGEDYAIITAIITLAEVLNLHIVAEGVETEEQLRILTVLGCDTVQGYLLGKPVSPELIVI